MTPEDARMLHGNVGSINLRNGTEPKDIVDLRDSKFAQSLEEGITYISDGDFNYALTFRPIPGYIPVHFSLHKKERGPALDSRTSTMITSLTAEVVLRNSPIVDRQRNRVAAALR
jgi:hypothetical protein